MICKICQKEFSNNLSGKLTHHLLNAHNMSIEDYVIFSDYNNIAPVCACGLCDNKPLFYRGKFSKYALNHDKYKFRELMYVDKYGIPKCHNCNKEIGFNRGQPNTYCSSQCSSLCVGYFLNPDSQNVVKESVKNKYGVDHISQVKEVAEKISKSNIGKIKNIEDQDVWKSNISKSMKKKWEDLDWKQKVSNAIKIGTNQEHVKKFRSELMISRLISSTGFKLSKLHKKIRFLLNLDDLGFISEQRVSRYCVDEINFDKRIIIEINGDYVHANPNSYNSNHMIVLGKNKILAKDKPTIIERDGI